MESRLRDLRLIDVSAKLIMKLDFVSSGHVTLLIKCNLLSDKYISKPFDWWQCRGFLFLICWAVKYNFIYLFLSSKNILLLFSLRKVKFTSTMSFYIHFLLTEIFRYQYWIQTFFPEWTFWFSPLWVGWNFFIKAESLKHSERRSFSLGPSSELNSACYMYIKFDFILFTFLHWYFLKVIYIHKYIKFTIFSFNIDI